MKLTERIELFIELGKRIKEEDHFIQEAIDLAIQSNRWFTEENIKLAIENISQQYLDEKKLTNWVEGYSVPSEVAPKVVGIVAAGNIPLVGFHDFLCVLISGNKAQIKLSSKDQVLMDWIIKLLIRINKEWKKSITITDRLKGVDGIIATGSNNSSRYFEYYFGKYPHIIRGHRNSVGTLKGNESNEELEKLGNDLFSYFGLGCRNVSKLMVPVDYDFNPLFESFKMFKNLSRHNKYQNNYDYNRTLMILNKTRHLSNEFVMVVEDAMVPSPIAVIHYEFYSDQNDLKQKLERDRNSIQIMIGKDYIPFGSSQSPELGDYADHIDVMKFLLAFKRS